MPRINSSYQPKKGVYDLPPYEKISKHDAIAWLAKQIDTNSSISSSRNHVRTAMKNHKKTLLDDYGINIEDQKINAAAFFSWAKTYSNWGEALAKIADFPMRPINISININVPEPFLDAFGVEIPNSLDELQRRYLDYATNNHDLKRENERLRVENQSLWEQLKNVEDEKARIREKNSLGGKKGAIQRGKKQN